MRSMIKKFSQNQQNGFILPILLITGVMVALMIVAVSGESVVNHQTATHAEYALEAQMAADAGLDDAMTKINTVTGWTGTGGDVTLLNSSSPSIKTTYNVTVADTADPAQKTLTVTAKAYFPSTAATPQVTRKYLMDIEAVTSGTGPTSVASGVGGLVLNGNAKISGGDVVVDGTISLSNNSQIGLSTNPLNVHVADQACPSPADATYPLVCGVGSPQPITMGTTAKIYGNVQAKNQTTGTNMSNPGLVACSGTNCDPIALPPFDRTGFKNTVNASGQALTGAAASTCSGGVVNWPANLKITGNVTGTNNCIIKINGNVWITGNVTFGNGEKMVIQTAVGTTTPSIVIDGSAGLIFGNNSGITPNSSNTGAEIVTFWSSAACSPDCSTVTGTDLFTSQNTTTINFSNNSSAANTTLYAYWSRALISNNGNLGAVAGQTVQLGNNAVINFTSSVPGSDNRVTTWVKRGYMRIYS
jgi:Tfp pilus assembly protein PilX